MQFAWKVVIFVVCAAVGVGHAVPECPDKQSVIRDQPDVLPIRPPLAIDFEGLISVHFTLNDGFVEGLHTLLDFIEPDCVSNYPQIKATLSIKVDSVRLYGNYELDASLLLPAPIQLIPIRGTGNLTVQSDHPHLQLVVKASHDNENETDALQIESAALEFGFDTLSLYCGNLRICGEVINWDFVNIAIKLGFNEFWATYKPLIDGLLSQIAIELLTDCTLTDLIENGDDCINYGGLLSAIIREQMAIATLMGMAETCGTTPPPSTPTPSTVRTTTTPRGPNTTEGITGSAKRYGHGHSLWSIEIIALYFLLTLNQ